MLEEKLNNIIESIEIQDRLSLEMAEAINVVNISLSDLAILAEVFRNMFPEKIESFADKLSAGLNDLNKPDLLTNEKNQKETEIAELFENNRDSLRCLNALNSILITDGYDPVLLDKLNPSYGFPPFKVHDNTRRNQYLEKLAESYVQGIDSDTIQHLLKTNNNIFLEHASFVKDVKAAIRITEREQLKKKIQSLDELDGFDLSESEIKAAVRQLERERLKEMMRKADTEVAPIISLTADTPVPKNETQKTSGKIIPIEKSGVNWKRYAVAASVIGLIAIATAIIYTIRKPSADIAGNETNVSDTGNIRKSVQKENDALTNNKFDSSEMISTVRKEGALGFAVKEEKVNVRVYRLNKNILQLKETDRQADSLRKMSNTYIFKNDSLTIYLTSTGFPVIYKIDNKYYLKIADSIYAVRPSDRPALLNKIIDRNILERADKIDHQPDNK